MFKPLNFKYIYIVAIFLAVGCAKESLSPDQTDAVLALSHIDNPETPDPDPEVDCKCYMRVTGAENFGNDPHTWSLSDQTGNPTFPVEFQGTGNDWIATTFPYQQHPLPTPFIELIPPSNGWHTFELWFFFGAPEGFKLHTEVRCFLQNGDGSQTLLTTTYHTFDFYGDGAEMPPVSASEGRRFTKFFSCLVQTDDPPKDPGSAG